MKFGKIDCIDGIDFTLPPDHEQTPKVLSKNPKKLPSVYVGCTNWNRQKLKNFYPKGTKDELTYYATQFNAIEMNAAFYRIFSEAQFEKWASKVTPEFRFFPKIYQAISHWKRLKNVENYVDENINAILRLEKHLEMPFLQMHNNFAPKAENIATLESFIENIWPKNFPLAFELRHEDWFSQKNIYDKTFQLFEKNKITSIITDTPGRRDLLHMRLTTPHAFIRYVGSNDREMDFLRTEYWVQRIKQWSDLGIDKIYFFIHQHEEKETVEIAKYFIENLNTKIGINIKAPSLIKENPQKSLF